MSRPQIDSFHDFRPYYVKAHSKKPTRIIHAIGTAGALACVPLAVATTPWALAAAPVIGYGLAWISHFFVEKNEPAAWGNPLWSLYGDFLMLWKMATGTMDAEVERILADRPAARSGTAATA